MTLSILTGGHDVSSRRPSGRERRRVGPGGARHHQVGGRRQGQGDAVRPRRAAADSEAGKGACPSLTAVLYGKHDQTPSRHTDLLGSSGFEHVSLGPLADVLVLVQDRIEELQQAITKAAEDKEQLHMQTNQLAKHLQVMHIP